MKFVHYLITYIIESNTNIFINFTIAMSYSYMQVP